MTTEGERIAKVSARAGLCSRRDAERLIAEGRVAVDGERIDTPAVRVRSDQVVTVDGRPLPEPAPPRLFRFHKPCGVVVAARDPQGRPTIYDILPRRLPRLMPVGRLDVASEGLLLLTNDGELKRRLELPATGWVRRYRVRAYGRVDPERLRELGKGIEIDGVRYGPVRVRLDAGEGANRWYTVTLREGKNREIRRIFEHLGLEVNRLVRVAYGPFQLGSLPKRAVEEVPGKVMREQLGGLLPAPPRETRRRRRAEAA
ncbi:Ribosomal large subunit pseudouridine synthase B [bacterium HR39]|nr:Ribosomal large subunit pseudouridine synthase B [bacterium HR39]